MSEENRYLEYENKIHLTDSEIDDQLRRYRSSYENLSLILTHKIEDEAFYDEDTLGRLEQKLMGSKMCEDIESGDSFEYVAKRYGKPLEELEPLYEEALKRNPRSRCLVNTYQELVVEKLQKPKNAIKTFNHIAGSYQSEYSDLYSEVGHHAGDPPSIIAEFSKLAYSIQNKLDKAEFENWKKNHR